MRWLHLISFATLAGGFMWKALFARPAQKQTQQPYFAQFTAASFARFRRIAQIALPIFGITAVYDLLRFAGWGAGQIVKVEIYLLAMIVLAAGVDVYGHRPNNPFTQRNLARLILLLLLMDALVQAGFDVTLAQGGGMWPWLVRWLHLAAFGLWFGGAMWNIFITVPAA
jgi:hypothetical protein